MTRQDFEREIQSIDDLVMFCARNQMSELLGNIYSEESMDDYINDYISDNIYNIGWKTIASELQDIPYAENYYLLPEGEQLQFTYISTANFQYYKYLVESYLTDTGYWNTQEDTSQFGDNKPELIGDGNVEPTVDFDALEAILAL